VLPACEDDADGKPLLKVPCDCESVSASERQDEEQMPRETGTRHGRTPPTGDPPRGEDPAEDPPPEGRAT